VERDVERGESARRDDLVRVAAIGASVSFATGIGLTVVPAIIAAVVTIARVGFGAGVDVVVVAAAADDRGRQSECASQRHDEEN
jgi:hypothetical protein